MILSLLWHYVFIVSGLFSCPVNVWLLLSRFLRFLFRSRSAAANSGTDCGLRPGMLRTEDRTHSMSWTAVPDRVPRPGMLQPARCCKSLAERQRALSFRKLIICTFFSPVNANFTAAAAAFQRGEGRLHVHARGYFVLRRRGKKQGETSMTKILNECKNSVG